MEVPNLERPCNRHLDNREFEALARPSARRVSSSSFLASAIRDAEKHAQACSDCHRKLEKYRQVLQGLSELSVRGFRASADSCATADTVDWHEVASGLWPEFKARQLIVHAATCGHCGPLLRAATNVTADPTPQEEQFLASIEPPSRLPFHRRPQPSFARQAFLWKSILQWRIAVPAFGLVLMLATFLTINLSSSGPLAGSRFAQFAVSTHRRHFQGGLALDVNADSQQVLNAWFKDNVPFPLTLPESPSLQDENRPYRLNGARLVRFRAKTAAFVAYQADAGAVSLMVAPDSIAVAAGGIEVPFKKVSFHYRNVEGYKVVTWSAHGLTYALVSQEGNRTQQSCMVCHSAMRDRDLTKTPAPLPETRNAGSHLWQ